MCRAGEPVVGVLEAADIGIATVEGNSPSTLAKRLLDLAGKANVVWVSSEDGDPGLTEAVSQHIVQSSEPPELELLVGSWDTPGSRLLDAVAVMDTLRSPGGCPWIAEQTHVSLTPYLVEEAFEAVEALEGDDREHRAEELGDVLLQVLIHARVAQDDPHAPFTVDDVAGRLVEKLLRRHPHVFARGEGSTASTPAEVEAEWESIKAQEKPHREGPLDGISSALPPLERATKVVSRLHRHDATAPLTSLDAASGDVGEALLALVARAHEQGVDPGQALRHTLARLEGGDSPQT